MCPRRFNHMATANRRKRGRSGECARVLRRRQVAARLRSSNRGRRRDRERRHRSAAEALAAAAAPATATRRRRRAPNLAPLETIGRRRHRRGDRSLAVRSRRATERPRQRCRGAGDAAGCRGRHRATPPPPVAAAAAAAQLACRDQVARRTRRGVLYGTPSTRVHVNEGGAAAPSHREWIVARARASAETAAGGRAGQVLLEAETRLEIRGSRTAVTAAASSSRRASAPGIGVPIRRGGGRSVDILARKDPVGIGLCLASRRAAHRPQVERTPYRRDLTISGARYDGPQAHRCLAVDRSCRGAHGDRADGRRPSDPHARRRDQCGGDEGHRSAPASPYSSRKLTQSGARNPGRGIGGARALGGEAGGPGMPRRA